MNDCACDPWRICLLHFSELDAGQRAFYRERIGVRIAFYEQRLASRSRSRKVVGSGAA